MKYGALILAVILCSVSAAGQSPESTASPSAARSKKAATKSASPAITLPPEKAQPVVIPRLDKPPVIDGKLDDEVWKRAAVLKDFYQTNPGDNIAPSKPTEVMIGYDSKFIYFAVHAFDDPSKVRASIAKRDEVLGEDNIRIFLDTFNDKRKAYVLGFNPLGVQQDGVMTEGGGSDFNVDVVMESKGVITEDGFTLEVAVPFKSLRYEAGKGKLWGLHVWRNIDRFDDEIDSWMPNLRDRASLLEQEGHITGLEGIATERTLEIIPTLTLSEEGRRVRAYPLAFLDANPGLIDNGRFVNKHVKADPGVSVKLGITPNVTLDFTANPDFAQVEADQPVVTANQRFPIFFAEKRPFFLEGADIFRTPIQAVHTRTIIDPDYAVKLTGKMGRNSFGLLLASDNAPGDYSEEDRNDPTIFKDIEKFVGKNAYVGVLRVKRDVGKESSLGLIATSYNFIEKHNQLAGIDGRLKIDKKTVFTFQGIGTISRRFFYDPNADKDVYRTGNAVAYNWNYDYTDRNFGYTIQGQGRTRDYRADVGFVPRTNTNNYGAFFRYNPDPKPKATFIGWTVVGGTTTNFDWQGRSQNAFAFGNLNLQFTKQVFINVEYDDFYERIFEEEFGPKRTATRQGAFFGEDSERSLHGKVVAVNANASPTKKISAYGFVGHRWNVFDFDFGAGPRFPRVSPAALQNPDAPLDPGAANTFDMEFGGSYKFTDSFNASLNYSRNRFTRNQTGRIVFIDNIYSLRATYQFTRFTFARARVDYDTLSASVRGQYLLGWAPNPGTSFYVGYNDDMNYGGFNPFSSLHERGFHRNGRTFFIKTSYLFRRSI
ncbi:MAG TPA: DUF5916 domain-containing protein [Blastocatellia bacterium]|nr:DUF5916 domain-containing protein [Blastocatellia bacterium]